uniref:PPC domain-containing protein n=1 Tax=Chloroflexus sp. TaxID=1904827 RepID=UPI002ACD5197
SARFYVKVRQYNGRIYGANTDYRLSMVSSAPDSYEPDNSLATARPITVNGPAQRHTFHAAGDQDWLVFAANAGTYYRFETLNLDSCSDTVLTLYDSGGQSLAADDDSGDGFGSRIDWIAPASGNYYLMVRHYNAGTGGACTAYDIRVLELGTPDSYEPDNSLATARPITVNGPAQRHTFHVAGDQDWVFFDAVAGARYVIRTFNLGSCSDTVLELYNAVGGLLARNDDSAGTLASRIEYTTPSSGRLLVRVRHYNPTSSGICTQYDLEVSSVSLAPDPYEPDDTMAQARAFIVNDTGQNRNFHTETDPDWVTFSASSGTTYTIYTYNLGSEADTVLELYHQNGTLITSNDDYGGSYASRIVWTAPASGNYYVKIRPYGSSGGRSRSTYSFRIVTGTALQETEEALNRLLTPLVMVQNEGVGIDGLRLVDIAVDTIPRPGQEFATTVYAVGQAASYKLVVVPKSDQVELLAIEPLAPDGQSLGVGTWVAQAFGDGDLAITVGWQSDQPATLLRLRWRLRTMLNEKQWVLPVQLLATDGNGQFWQSTATIAVPTVAAGAKIESVAPTRVTISAMATITIRVVGLEGELPKAYLVDLNGQSEQQFAAIAYAPDSADTLIASLDPSFKPGVFKVRLDLADGSRLFADPLMHLLASDATLYDIYIPMTLR